MLEGLMSKLYETKDLYLASYLYSTAVDKYRGASLDGRIYWFTFENSEELQQYVSDYWAEKAMCNAKRYVNAIRTLKDIVLS